MEDDSLSLIDLKKYPHFDKYLPPEEIRDIVNSPQRVAENAFYPFVEYNIKNRTFKGKLKTRTIRYACRKDSYIFAYYRNLLLELYEQKLIEYGIQDCPIAYRKILDPENLNFGKCNIHFAYEAFKEIQHRGQCFAMAFDIKSFFDSLNHCKLKKLWCNLLKVEILPPDHAAVFKAITQYAVVDRDTCYERLGHLQISKIGNRIKKTFKFYKEIPMQLCKPEAFREKICGENSEFSSLIKKNEECYGIPQGAPISDLLANLYLIDFDKKLYDFSKEVGGFYRRYSDDILFICPSDKDILSKVEELICHCAEREFLSINKEKTNITEFYLDGNFLKHKPLRAEEKNSQKLFEYLGFSFDGQKAFIRDKTLSGYYRKMTFSIREEAKNLIKRYPGKTLAQIKAKINLSQIAERYGKISNSKTNSDSKKTNFFSYIKKASNIMKEMGEPLLLQLRNSRRKWEHLLNIEIEKEYEKKSAPSEYQLTSKII